MDRKIIKNKTIKFGRYPQGRNGEIEDIEWIVMDVQGSKAFLLSRFALDCPRYDTSWSCVTWETCYQRRWLNESFFDQAFTANEKKLILNTLVPADRNPSFDISSGNDTNDKIFSLSIVEAKKFFESDEYRLCAPTDYAISRGACTSAKWNKDYKTDGIVTCWWWLRSPGYFLNYASFVFIDGSVSDYGHGVGDGDGAVRPALWADFQM